MKKSSIFCCIGTCCAALLFTGCVSTDEGQPAAVAAKSVEVQQVCHPSAVMKLMNVNVVVVDKRPKRNSRGFGVATVQRPELYYQRTIDLPKYMVDYLYNAQAFKSIKASPVTAPGEYELRLNWLDSRCNLNAWIPFVIRFRNHMAIQMELINPKKQVIWSYKLNNHVINTPSAFRVVHRIDLFQQRLMEKEMPKAIDSLCKTVK